jgi:hypothetical protein
MASIIIAIKIEQLVAKDLGDRSETRPAAPSMDLHLQQQHAQFSHQHPQLSEGATCSEVDAPEVVSQQDLDRLRGLTLHNPSVPSFKV